MSRSYKDQYEIVAKVVAKKIRELRGDMRQEDFAEKLGVVQPAISRWESGRIIPSLFELLATFGKNAPDIIEVAAAAIRKVERETGGNIKGSMKKPAKPTKKAKANASVPAAPAKPKAAPEPKAPIKTKAQRREEAQLKALSKPDPKPIKKSAPKPSTKPATKSETAPDPKPETPEVVTND